MIPVGETMVGVVSVTTPIRATRMPRRGVEDLVGRKHRLAGVLVETTLAARYGNSAPVKACSPSPKQPSTPTVMPSQAVTSSVNVPSVAAEIRRSSSVPRSNSWLPTEETSRPIALSTSMVGSSLKTLDSNGEALIRSPAPTKNDAAEPRVSRRKSLCRRCTVAATFAEPPTSIDDVVALAGSFSPKTPSGPGAVTSWLSAAGR